MKHAERGTATASTSGTRGDIQGLRAVAVGTVVLSHAGVAGFAGGYVGVDVFFVISGFLITGILAREAGRTGRVSVLDFYARRARRILPAASVTLVAITIASWLAFGYIRVSQVLHHVVWAALFGANLHFARAGSDYFAADSFLSPVQHFWSLAVEEQFYLLWPLLIVLVTLVRPGPRQPVILRVLLTLLCVASFAWCMQETATTPTSAYFSTLARGWELGAGALLALSVRHVRRLTRGFLAVLSWAGLALIAWSCLTYSAATPFPGKAAAVPVLGSVLVLAGGLRPTPYGASLLLDRAPMRRLGDISYSLYLVHWPVLTIPAMAAGAPLGAYDRVVLVALSITLAALSYRWVETPFRSAATWHRGRRALALWPAALALVLGAVFAVGSQVGGTAASGRIELDPRQSGHSLNIRLAVEHAASRSAERAPLPPALTPDPLDLKDANWHLPGNCWATTEEDRHDVCSMGDTRARRTLVLIGDSHIGMWTAPISDLAKKAHWKVAVFLKTGCPPIDVTIWRPERSDVYAECDRWRDWAYGQVAALKPARIVVAGYTRSELADPATGKALAGGDGEPGTRALEPGMRSALDRLTAITGDVSVLADTTTLPQAAVDCLGARKATLHTCAVAMNEVAAARNDAWHRAAKATGARWIDTEQWLCPENRCPLVVGNVIVYTDRHHLTTTFAWRLRPLLADSLRL